MATSQTTRQITAVVCVGSTSDSIGLFDMRGGNIQYNTAYDGGGVYVYCENVTLSGGRIVNNTKTGNPNNILLVSNKIKLGQAIAENALFGINDTGVFANACDTDYSQYFFSDKGNKVVYKADKTLEVENVLYNVEIKGDMVFLKSDGASALVVASYEESGKLIDTKLINIAAETVDRKTITETGISTQNARTVKAMLWEGLTSLKSLASCAEKTYTNQTNE